MQPMSDKELDKLFRAEFESFEVEPSAGLWDRIDAELGTAPAQEKKKVFPIFWMAAASVVAVMTAGIYFLQPSERVQLRGRVKTEIAEAQPSTEKPSQEIEQPTAIAERSQAAPAEQIAKPALLAVNEKVGQIHEPENTGADAAEVNSGTAIESSRIASNTTLASTPELSVSQAEKMGASSLRANPQPSLVAMLSPEAKEANEVEQASPKQKIRSLGDLVNRVVAKVDPRDEKIIEFTDNDEGTEVSGINLGLIKFKHNHNANK